MAVNSKNFPFWVLAISAFLAPTLPRLLTEGMFMDGLLYSVISRNLAIGVGSFWKPMINETMTPGLFSDHPPLVFGIQSFFFRVLGDHPLTENVYSLFTAVVTAALIIALWRTLTRNRPDFRRLAWLPLFFWPMIPLVTWSYSNNMLENTLGVFTTGACLVLINGLVSDRRLYLHVGLAGLLICAGLLAKGMVALFPASTIGVYWLVFRRPGLRATVGYTILLVAVAAAAMGLVLLGEDARYNLSQYVDKQFMPSMTGQRGSVGSQFVVMGKLLSELAPGIGVCAIALLVSRFKRHAVVDGSDIKRAALCTGIGLCGSLPIVLSPRQSGFYLVPSFPLFAVGFAVLIVRIADAFMAKINQRAVGFKVFSVASVVILLFVIGYSASRFGEVGRDKATIRDVKLIGDYVGTGTQVSISPSMRAAWSLHGYFSRYYRMSLDPGEKTHQFLVIRDGRSDGIELGPYEFVDLGTTAFELYQKRKSPQDPRDPRAR